MEVRDLLEAFQKVLRTNNYLLPIDTHGVVVLSGPSHTDKNYQIAHPSSEENKARIHFGIEVIRKIGEARNGKEQWYADAPQLILNGERNQLSMMVDYALQTDIPANLIALVDCSNGSHGNTKTQFEEINKLYGNQQGIFLFITSGYHVPRAELTAAKQLSKEFTYEVLPVPFQEFPFSIYKIRGELRKISLYLAKGDLAGHF